MYLFRLAHRTKNIVSLKVFSEYVVLSNCQLATNWKICGEKIKILQMYETPKIRKLTNCLKFLNSLKGTVAPDKIGLKVV